MPVKKIAKTKIKSSVLSARVVRPVRSLKSRGPAPLRPAGARSSLSASRTERTARQSRVLPRVTPPEKKSSLSASLYDLKGKAVGRMTLPAEIFGIEDKPKLIAQAVRVYMSNQRQGNASTKNRGEVQGSTRKIYRQKGTGKARHGGIRAPIFVGGGVALGPRPHDFLMTLPQKAKRLALFSALSAKLRDDEIKIVSDLEKIQPKTKLMAKALEALDASGKTLMVVPGGYKDFENVYRSGRNIEGLKILTASTLNTYEVLDNSKIILMKDSIDILKKHFLKS